MYSIDFKDFVNIIYVSVFGEITSWEELQMWFDVYEKEERNKRKFMKRFKWFCRKIN